MGMSDNHPVKDSIDLGLAILRSRHPGIALNCTEISHFCGCHQSRIAQIEKRAIQKLRGRLWGCPEILEELRLRL